MILIKYKYFNMTIKFHKFLVIIIFAVCCSIYGDDISVKNLKDKDLSEKYISINKGSLKNKNYHKDIINIKKWPRFYNPIIEKRAYGNKKGISFYRKINFNKISHPIINFKDINKDLYVKNLIKKSRLNLDKTPFVFDNKLIYQMILMDVDKYQEISRKLNFKDINRYSFKRNMTSNEIPINAVSNN